MQVPVRNRREYLSLLKPPCGGIEPSTAPTMPSGTQTPQTPSTANASSKRSLPRRDSTNSADPGRYRTNRTSGGYLLILECLCGMRTCTRHYQEARDDGWVFSTDCGCLSECLHIQATCPNCAFPGYHFHLGSFSLLGSMEAGEEPEPHGPPEDRGNTAEPVSRTEIAQLVHSLQLRGGCYD